jgi:hypothetical protein
LGYVSEVSPRAKEQVVLGSDVAANTEISETVTAGETWELVAVSVSLAQAATQTPLPILIVDDGTSVIFEMFGSTTVQAVNTTTQYTWFPGAPLTGQVGATTNVHSTGPLPPGLTLKAGSRIRTSTIGIGANSNYGVPSITVRKAKG